MGETSRKRDRERFVTLNPASIAALAAAVRTPAVPEAPAGTPPPLWTRPDAAGQPVCAAMIDDANALRWVPLAELGDTPAAWRPLYLGDAR